jgi:hypothetical protein
LESVGAVFPREPAEGFCELVFEDVRRVPEDLEVELPPAEFIEEDLGGPALFDGDLEQAFFDFAIDGADGDEPEAKVLREAGGALQAGEVALFGVTEQGSVEKVGEAREGGVLSSLGKLGGGGRQFPCREGRQGEGGDFRGLEPRDGADGSGFGEFAPSAGVGGENAEGGAGSCEDLVAFVEGDVFKEVQGDAPFAGEFE